MLRLVFNENDLDPKFIAIILRIRLLSTTFRLPFPRTQLQEDTLKEVLFFRSAVKLKPSLSCTFGVKGQMMLFEEQGNFLQCLVQLLCFIQYLKQIIQSFIYCSLLLPYCVQIGNFSYIITMTILQMQFIGCQVIQNGPRS